MAPKDSWFLSLEPVNANFLGKKVFADVIKWRILRWWHSGLCGCNHKHPWMREANRRGEGNATTEAEIAVTWPQTTELQGPPEAGRGKEWSPPRECGPCQTPGFWLSDDVRLLANRTVWEHISVVLGHQACGNLFSHGKWICVLFIHFIYVSYIYTYLPRHKYK